MNRPVDPVVPARVPETERTERDVRPEIGGARILSLAGRGPDGLSYLGRSELDGDVEVFRLLPHAITDARRRALAALRSVSHEGLLPILHVDLDSPFPHVVVGRMRRGSDDLWRLPPDALRERAARLADALRAAHRLDVVHGALDLSCVGLDEHGHARLDLTGLRVHEPLSVSSPPELARGGLPSAASDVFALGAILSAAPDAGALEPVLSAMRDPDPERRPRSADVARALTGLEATPVRSSQHVEHVADDAPSDPERFGIPARLGAYELLQQVGAGGMGRVFRARDLAGGPDVAIKVLLSAWAKDAELVARFQREARVLAQVQSPFVARFVAANEEAGFHYLVMEHVDAPGLDEVLAEREKLDLELALGIVCDVARALSEVHALGLVHRDVKPANVLVDLRASPPIVKLCDFGIARSVDPAGSDLTQGASMGTPSYMAPEQIDESAVDARADVYALGATLYCLLAGQPPFVGPAASVMLAHVSEAPQPLRERDPSIPIAVDEVVMRCLAKAPDERYRSAAELHDALQAAWRGAAASADALPQALGLSGAPRVYDFAWSLRATPDELWPHVSNTERLNRAAGLDDVEWTHTPGDDYVQTEGRFRAAGMELRWKERPFEWIAPSRLGVVREYVAGPFQWLRSTVELRANASGGTDLRHRVEILPRGLIGRAAASVEVGLRLRRSLDRVYRRIDDACAVTRERAVRGADPFEPAPRVPRDLRERLDGSLGKVVRRGGDPAVVEALAEFVCSASEPRLARVRPRVWARENGLDEHAVLETFLLAASEGVLELLWDILCPSCRVPSSVEESLRALSEHGRCEVCDLDFELDMARSVELVFRVHPALRHADLGVYCIGGPAHSPHVLAQVRLAPSQRFELDVALEPGHYRVTGRGLPRRWSFAVHERAPFDVWDLPLRAGAAAEVPRSLRPGGQRIVLTNDLGHEVVVRLERAADRDDAVTAADAASCATFRALFSDQVLAPDRLVAVSDVALLFVRIADAVARYEREEAAVQRELLALSQEVRDAATLEGGALVKLEGDGVMAVFSDRVASARAVRRLWRPGLGIALHAGPARMATIAQNLDYFGKTVCSAELMSRWTEGGELLVSETVLEDARIARALAEHVEVRGYVRVGAQLVSRMLPTREAGA